MADSVDTDPPLDDYKEAPPAFERDTTLNIYQRIHKVMVEVGGKIAKDGKIEMRGGKAIEYISHDAVTAHVRDSCIKHGIFVHPTVQNLGNNGNRTELTVHVHFINVDKPDDKVRVVSVGYGVDSSDKGPGKAWSYAVKYAYLKLFMLNSADDIELADLAHDPETTNQSAVDAAHEETRDAREAWAYSIRDAIKAAKSPADLKQLRRVHKAALEAAPASTLGYFNAMFEERGKELEAAEQPPGDA